MNDIIHKQMVQEAVKKKFGSHKVLLCKHNTAYPKQAEREFERIAGSYMRILNGLLKEYLPEIKNAAEEEKNSTRHDDTSDLIIKCTKIFEKILTQLKKNTEKQELEYRALETAVLTGKLSVAEWKKAVRKTLGIDLEEDYYNGELYRRLLEEWTENSVSLIKSIPENSLSEMRELVLQGYRNGKPTTAIVKDIQHIYKKDKRHAQFVAQDQIAKLNSSITKFQQEDAGVSEYIWSTSGDGRVRKSHAVLDGKRFKWSEPPIVDKKSGRRCHPGEDYRCRCVALPVFDFDTIDLPVRM